MHIEVREQIEKRLNGGFASQTQDFHGFSIFLMKNLVDGTFLHSYEWVISSEKDKILEDAEEYACKVRDIINSVAGRICFIEHVVYKQKQITVMEENSRKIIGL